MLVRLLNNFLALFAVEGVKVFEDLAGQQVLVTLIVLHQLVYLLVKNRPHSNYLRNLVVFVAVHKRTYIVSFFYDLL